MSELLAGWINEEVRLAAPVSVTSFDRDFADGYQVCVRSDNSSMVRTKSDDRVLCIVETMSNVLIVWQMGELLYKLNLVSDLSRFRADGHALVCILACGV